MPKKEPANKKIGIYVYCSESDKMRLKRVARSTGRTLSGYVMQAALKLARRDEKLLKIT